MNLHFGESTATKEALYLNFAKQKAEFQSMQNWNPEYKEQKLLEKGNDNQTVKDMTAMLIEKTKQRSSYSHA